MLKLAFVRGHVWDSISHLVEDDPLTADCPEALEIQMSDVSQRQVRHRQRRMSDHSVCVSGLAVDPERQCRVSEGPFR